MQVSFLLAPSMLSILVEHIYDQYARPQMLKNTCETSLAKMGVGVVGLVSDQLMKSVCNQRNKEFSTNLQGEGWIVKNLELACSRRSSLTGTAHHHEHN